MKPKTPEEDLKLCQGCTKCCESILITIQPPRTAKDIDEIKWYLLHNVHVYINDKGEWIVDIPMKCTKLNNKGLCSIHESRLQICREYSQDSCERYDTEDYFKELFTSVEEFEEYLSKQKINIT